MTPFVNVLWPTAAETKVYRRYEGSSFASSPIGAEWALGDGEWEIRWQLRLVTAPSASTIYLIGVGNEQGEDTGYNFHLNTSGQLRMVAYYDDESFHGWNATTNLTSSLDDVPFWLRAHRVGDTWTAQYSTDLDTWTTIMTKTESRGFSGLGSFGAAIGAIRTNGDLSTVNVADDPVDFMRFQLWTGGVEGTGTLVKDFNPSLAATGTPANFEAATGETWTFNEGAPGTWAIVELP